MLLRKQSNSQSNSESNTESHTESNRKSQRTTLSRHSQLFLHVVLIHAIVMYLCSWYVEHARAKTAMWILTTNRTIGSLSRAPIS